MKYVDPKKYNFGILISDIEKLKAYYNNIKDETERIAFLCHYAEGKCCYCKYPIWGCEDYVFNSDGCIAHEKCLLKYSTDTVKYTKYNNPLRDQIKRLKE